MARHKLLINLANSFSSGLFLSVGVLHILPEAMGTFKEYLEWKTINSGFPWPFFIALVVYQLVLYLEKISLNVHDFVDHHHD